jgi:hypothetical protein
MQDNAEVRKCSDMFREPSLMKQSILESEAYELLVEKVLSRVGFHEAVPEVVGRDSHPDLAGKREPLSDQVLQRINDLRRQYAAYPCDAQIHSQWNGSLVRDIDMVNFRADSAYLWQHRDGNVPVSYLATYYFHRLSRNADLLDQCTEDGGFGAYSIHVDGTIVTRDRLDSVAELGFLRKVFSLNKESTIRILDIGSGYGRIAWRFYQCFPKVEVLCVDGIPESAAICESYLARKGVAPNVRMVPLPMLEEEMKRNPPALAIAMNSLTECTAKAVTWWIRMLEQYAVPNLLVIPHSGFDEGRELFSVESLEEKRVPLLPLLQEHGYRQTLMEPKYEEPTMQRYGISPTYFHLFSR